MRRHRVRRNRLGIDGIDKLTASRSLQTRSQAAKHGEQRVGGASRFGLGCGRTGVRLPHLGCSIRQQRHRGRRDPPGPVGIGLSHARRVPLLPELLSPLLKLLILGQPVRDLLGGFVLGVDLANHVEGGGRLAELSVSNLLASLRPKLLC